MSQQWRDRIAEGAQLGDLQFIHGTPKGFKGTEGFALYRVQSEGKQCLSCSETSRPVYRWAMMRGEARIYWVPGSYCSLACARACTSIDGPLVIARPGRSPKERREFGNHLVAALVLGLLAVAFSVGVSVGRYRAAAEQHSVGRAL